MAAYIVLRDFEIAPVMFTVGQIVSDPIYVELFSQETSTYASFVGKISAGGSIPLDPLPGTSDRDLILFEIQRAQNAEQGLLQNTTGALEGLLLQLFPLLPTTYPASPNVLWNNGGTLSIS
jgi:hypothetical protein